jgi:protein RecA
MVARYQPKVNGATGGDYFPARDLEFISSGCTLLDLVLGGGWIIGRPVNIVGDKSVGKTLIAIEASANLRRKFPRGNIWYRESEAAFDISYAKRVGLPADKVDFGLEGIDTLWDTVDQVFDDAEHCISLGAKSKQPGLYIIDSLDALTSDEERKRDRSKGTYGQSKAKTMSEMFRVLVRGFKKSRICFMVISQIRDKIGATFGVKYTRTGGKALDFYSNQTVYLSHIGTIVKTVNGMKRVLGVRIRAKCTKNKVAESFGECEFVIRFGYGIDDFRANVEWLAQVGALEDIGVDAGKSALEAVEKYLIESDKLPDDKYEARVRNAQILVRQIWKEESIARQPKRQKYGERRAE